MTRRNYTLSNIIDIAKKDMLPAEKKELARLLPDFVDVLIADLDEQIFSADRNGKNTVDFVNFWSVSWDEHLLNFKAGFVNTSSARKLTKKFNQEGSNFDDIADFFYYTITKPPQFFPMLERLTGIAKNDTTIRSELHNGEIVSLLFKTFFLSLLKVTYDNDGVLKIRGLGTFRRWSKKIPDDNTSAILHFKPSITI